MKAGFALPSCNYNIVLSKEDLQQLLETGYITVRPDKDAPCHTSRSVWNEEKRAFESLDRKVIPNNLQFILEENVADIEGGPWHVQFLGIFIEGFKKENR